MQTSLENLNAKVFREHLGSKFNVHFANIPPLVLELLEVEESDPSPEIELFSLQFRGPFQPRLDQRTHRMEHEQLGVVEIFLTPISADQQSGTVYESVFHRFRKS